MTSVLGDTKAFMLFSVNAAYSKGWNKENMFGENLSVYQGLEVVSEALDAWVEIADQENCLGRSSCLGANGSSFQCAFHENNPVGSIHLGPPKKLRRRIMGQGLEP